jgi:hypothetical protein
MKNRNDGERIWQVETGLLACSWCGPAKILPSLSSQSPQTRMLRSDHTLALVCHPETPAPAARAIAVRVTHGPDGRLVLEYWLCGDIANLLIPAPRPPGPEYSLWEHTCFEAFVAVVGGTAYREFNFSPSGQWAAYTFSGYRQRDEGAASRIAPAFCPQIVTRALADRLELDAAIAPDALPPNPRRALLQLGLSTVVEAADGSRTYWALRHTAARPDFHDRDAFTLELADLRTPV